MKNEPGFTRLSAAETEALLKRPQLRVLDVRDANAFACEHIAGAIHFNGATCLMYAASSGKTEVLIRLLAGGASLDLTSLDDFSALDMAANIECLQLLSNAARRQRQGLDRLA